MDYIKFTPGAVANFARANHLTQKQRPWAFPRIVDSMTKSQVQSKLWLGEELINIQSGFRNVAVIGGWFCHILGIILFDELKCNFVCNYDTDRDSQLISYKFNTRYKDAGCFSATTKNLFISDKLDQKQNEIGSIDLVVNCSCEHMFYMREIKEKHFNDGQLFVLQSTDCEEYDDHINCVSGPDELSFQAGLVEVYYSGTKVLDNGMNRFMVIGR
tara:strand:- start:122 stop:766 length:645 start_codon:yes stop_codon:yes gene_type:complete